MPTSKPPRDPIYKAIPEEYVECLLSRRHVFPPLHQQRRQHVVLRYGDGPADQLDMTEHYGTCTRCGTERTLTRDRYTHRYLQATYAYPDGYLPPPGVRWDRDALWTEHEARHPVTGKAEVRDLR